MTLTAAVVGFVNTLVVLVSQFGWHVSDTQQAAITGATTAGMVLGAALYDQLRGIKKVSLPTSNGNPSA